MNKNKQQNASANEEKNESARQAILMALENSVPLNTPTVKAAACLIEDILFNYALLRLLQKGHAVVSKFKNRDDFMVSITELGSAEEVKPNDTDQDNIIEIIKGTSTKYKTVRELFTKMDGRTESE